MTAIVSSTCINKCLVLQEGLLAKSFLFDVLHLSLSRAGLHRKGQEFFPRLRVGTYLRTVKLSHVSKMLKEQRPIVIGDTPDFIPALIGEEKKLLLLALNLCALLGKHELSCHVLILEELVLHADHLRVVLEAAPLGDILLLEQCFLLVHQSPIGALKCLVYLLTHAKQVLERVPLVQVVLQVAGERRAKHIAEVLHIDACRGHHLGQVLEDQRLRGRLNPYLQLRHLGGESLHLLDGREEVLRLGRQVLRYLDHCALQNLVRLRVVVHLHAELLAGTARLDVDFGRT